MQKEVWIAVDSLQKEQRDVIKIRYKENGTFEEIGKKTGVCTSKVHSIQKNALKSLSARNNRGYLKKYYDEYISSASFVHVGVSEFNRTWTSSVEKAVIYNER